MARHDSATAALWATPSAADEARALFVFMQRNGASVTEMTRWICVSDAEYQELCEWASAKPGIGGRLNDMMEFRDHVLRAFQVLVGLHAVEKSACSS